MSVAKRKRVGRHNAPHAGNPPRPARVAKNRSPGKSSAKSRLPRGKTTTRGTTASSLPETGAERDIERRERRPSVADESVAIHVSRAALRDISRQLQVAVATAAACRAGLMAQKADADTNADIVLSLQWSVIDVIRRQISRLSVIAGAAVEKGLVIATVTR